MKLPLIFDYKVTFIAAFIFFIFPLTSYSKTLGENAQVSLLTASPGDELYSVFGHSALRVLDSENNIDLVFNYGTFDFNTPNFYMKFVRGKLLYKLSVTPTQYFIPEYQYEGRALFEQVLDLSPEQKQQIFDFLIQNSLPQNAYYHYDFFYDNCSTRIRDIIELVIQPQWPSESDINQESIATIKSDFNYQYHYEPWLKPNRTLRDMLQPFLITMPWSAFGIDLALGLPADKIAQPWEFMYLPDEMLVAFALAQHPDGRSLVLKNNVILTKTLELSPPAPFTPLLATWLIFLVAVISIFKLKWSIIFDKVYFSLLGLTGITVVFLWFFTDHITTKTNLVILWAIPTHLYYIWVMYSGRQDKRWAIYYFRFTSLISLALLIAWPWIPQAFNAAFFPLVLIAFIKSGLLAFNIPLEFPFMRKGK